MSYHLEHHLYPSVPFYNLLRLHIELRQTVYLREDGYYETFIEGLRRLVKSKRLVLYSAKKIIA